MCNGMLQRAWHAWGCVQVSPPFRRLQSPPTDLHRLHAPRYSSAGMFSPWSDATAVWSMLTASWLDLLLLSVPLGLVSGHLGCNPTLVFISVSCCPAHHAMLWHDVEH